MVRQYPTAASFIISILAAALLLLPSCKVPNVQTDTANNTSPAIPNYTFPNPPPPPPPGNTKISSVLRGLIQAQKEGNAAAFAAERGIKLQDGKVLVTINSAQGQIRAAANATVNAGGELTTGLDYPPLFDAYVPITNLEALAINPSILVIEVPKAGVPVTN